MSSTPAAGPVPGSLAPSAAAERRVREQARDALVLMVFSLALSVSCAVAFLLLTRLGR